MGGHADMNVSDTDAETPISDGKRVEMERIEKGVLKLCARARWWCGGLTLSALVVSSLAPITIWHLLLSVALGFVWLFTLIFLVWRRRDESLNMLLTMGFLFSFFAVRDLAGFSDLGAFAGLAVMFSVESWTLLLFPEWIRRVCRLPASVTEEEEAAG